MPRPDPRQLRLVPRIDTWPSLIRFVEGPLGKLTILTVFAAGLWLHGEEWWLDATLLLSVLSFWPAQRRALLLAGTWYWLSKHTWFNWTLIKSVASREGVSESIDWSIVGPALVVSVLTFCAGFHYAVVRYRSSRLLRRPILALLVTYVGLLLIAGYAPLGGLVRTLLWAFLIVLGRYLWVLGYSLIDQGARSGREVVLQLGHYLPFWLGTSGTPTPFPKGSAFLRKAEASNASELAVSQLKGVKLLFWAGVLLAVKQLLQASAYGYQGRLPRMLGMTSQLGIPTYADAFARSLEGAAYAWYIGWLALMVEFLTDLLHLAIWGHILIATCRMSGFNVLRNTYRPLESRSIAEFWNRYYYYFKELLVAFFFYPTYLRYFRRHPRLRLFFATLAAAGFGNLLYHYLRDIHYIVKLGPWEALLAFRVYALYSLLLGTAIGVSQLRGRSRRKQRTWLQGRVLAPASVLLFYCVLSVFDDPDRSLSIGDHFTFLLSLLGVG